MNTPVNPSLQASPTISQWIDIRDDGTVAARTGKSEIGQGISTALTQIVADELRVPIGRIEMRPPDTAEGPDENFTAGSLSIQHSGSALAAASRAALALLASAAAERLGEPIMAAGGARMHSANSSLDYADLAAAIDLDVPIESVSIVALPLPEPGDSADSQHAVGSSAPRRDLPGKVLGEPSYLQDLRLPGMRFGRMVRPGFRGARLAEIPDAAGLPGDAVVVCEGSVVGVVAEHERDAIAAADIVRERCRWTGDPVTLDDEQVAAFLAAAPTDDTTLAEGPAPDDATYRARYSRPFLAHASIGTSCAVARVDDAGIEVWSHTQGVYPLQRDIARALSVPQESVTVHHVEGAGCYGHNPADDAAFDAVLLARNVPGVPVHVTWMREDELSWGPMAPAMVVDVAVSTDESGRIRSWSWDGFGNGHSSRPSTLPSPSLLAYADQPGGQAIPPSQDPPLAAGAGTGRNAIPAYRCETVRAVAHRLTTMPMRASAMRSLGAHMNVFAIESTVDDLAHAHGRDPVAYRLDHLDDPRARAVIEKAAELADWGSPSAPDHGRGIAFARYKNSGAWCAVVAEIEAVDSIDVLDLWIAVDCGRAVNPDGIVNQIEGGAVQSVSWTLKEKVRFRDGRVTSGDWEAYPILRFTEAPRVRVAVIDRPDQPWVGAGEAASGPTAAALGNAVRDALGIRVRHLPLTPEAIVTAMAED